MARAGALLTPLAPVVLAALAAPRGAGAQAARPARAASALTLELRAEAAADREPGAFAGGGALVDAGSYVRLGVLAGAGVVRTRPRVGDARVGAAAEVALVGRFLLDPFRQSARGVYAGGGVAVRAADGDGRPFVVLAVGVEGRARGGTAPAVELGLGHGVRLGAALRRARPGRR